MIDYFWILGLQFQNCAVLSFRNGGPEICNRQRWAFTDLWGNTTKGVAVELVKADGGELIYRDGWRNYDVKPTGGLTIEVKCPAFHQSWSIARRPDIGFARLQVIQRGQGPS